MLIPLTVAAAFTPIQIGVGDWIANTVAELQPAKLAAMEAQYETQARRRCRWAASTTTTSCTTPWRSPTACRC